MYSKSKGIATALIALFAIGCASVLPWHDEPVATEVNVAFTVQNNLLFLTTPRIENVRGRFFFGSASAHSVLDPKFVALIGPHPAYDVEIGQKEAIRINPVVLDLGTSGDALIGADVWGNRAITIDYRTGLLTYQKEGIHPEGMALFRYSADPEITMQVDGANVAAIVDTASPDTVTLPRPKPGRGTAHVSVAGQDFGTIDVGYANVPVAHIGNRLLSRFLVTIDYGKHVVGLWRDPRIASR